MKLAKCWAGKRHANWKFSSTKRDGALPIFSWSQNVDNRDPFARNCSIMSSYSAVAWHIDQWIVIIIRSLWASRSNVTISFVFCRRSEDQGSAAASVCHCPIFVLVNLCEISASTSFVRFSHARRSSSPLFWSFSSEMQRTVRIDFLFTLSS